MQQMQLSLFAVPQPQPQPKPQPKPQPRLEPRAAKMPLLRWSWRGKGKECLCEYGCTFLRDTENGHHKRCGEGAVICGPHGERLKPLARDRGRILFEALVGTVFLAAEEDQEEGIQVFSITRIEYIDQGIATTMILCENVEFDDIPTEFRAAALVGLQKARGQQEASYCL